MKPPATAIVSIAAIAITGLLGAILPVTGGQMTGTEAVLYLGTALVGVAAIIITAVLEVRSYRR